MKGGFVRDISMVVGVMILTALIIYWALNHGVDMMGELMYSTPTYVDDYMATAVSQGCVFKGDMSTSFEIKPISMDLDINGTHAGASAKGRKYWSDVRRGGYIDYKSSYPVPYIDCDSSEIEKGKTEFNDKFDSKILVIKKNNNIEVGTK